MFALFVAYPKPHSRYLRFLDLVVGCYYSKPHKELREYINFFSE